jgi:hypothetical protein
MKLSSSLVSLFLARPLGARNLLQRIFEVVTEVSKTNSELENAMKILKNKDYCTRINAWVEKNYEPNLSSAVEEEADSMSSLRTTVDLRTARMEVETALLTAPVGNKTKTVNVEEVRNLSDEMIVKAHIVLMLRMRKKDKETFIEIFGQEEMIQLMKEVLPVIYEPLIDVYAHADAGEFFNEFFLLLKSCISIAESKVEELDKLERYSQAFQVFEKAWYQFGHNIISKDKGTLHSIFKWLFDRFRLSTRFQLNFVAHFETLDKEVQQQVIQELDQLTQFQNIKNHLRQTGQAKVADSMAPPHNNQAIMHNFRSIFLQQVEKGLQAFDGV